MFYVDEFGVLIVCLFASLDCFCFVLILVLIWLVGLGLCLY